MGTQALPPDPKTCQSCPLTFLESSLFQGTWPPEIREVFSFNFGLSCVCVHTYAHLTMKPKLAWNSFYVDQAGLSFIKICLPCFSSIGIKGVHSHAWLP